MHLSFGQRPPSDLIARFNAAIVHDENSKATLKITFLPRGPGAIFPRDILREFEPYGVNLLPERSSDEQRVNRDLWMIGTRTLICAVLTVPVLILTWADLPPHPIAYQAISLALATCVECLAWPLISSCIRSVIYLHQMDLSVLVAVSTLTAWMFSTVAFVFLCIGRPFADPYFETVTLLVTLVFLGKVIQVATRRSSGSAVRKLQALQQTEVFLLCGIGEEETCQPMDAR
jgi:Cu2+-exporting ATPase